MMNRLRSRSPHTPDPMASGPRTVAGLVAFALAMALVVVTLLAPLIGSGVIAGIMLVGVGRAVY